MRRGRLREPSQLGGLRSSTRAGECIPDPEGGGMEALRCNSQWWGLSPGKAPVLCVSQKVSLALLSPGRLGPLRLRQPPLSLLGLTSWDRISNLGAYPGCFPTHLRPSLGKWGVLGPWVWSLISQLLCLVWRGIGQVQVTWVLTTCMQSCL